MGLSMIWLVGVDVAVNELVGGCELDCQWSGWCVWMGLSMIWLVCVDGAANELVGVCGWGCQ